jgi:predicted HTH transcriptional regulator
MMRPSLNKSRIGSAESTTLEWKPSLSQIHEIIESITAFANTEGGRLLAGVSKYEGTGRNDS